MTNYSKRDYACFGNQNCFNFNSPTENGKSPTNEQEDSTVGNTAKQLNYASEAVGSSHEDVFQDNTSDNTKSPINKQENSTEAVGSFSTENFNSALLTVTQMVSMYAQLDASEPSFQELKKLLKEQNWNFKSEPIPTAAVGNPTKQLDCFSEHVRSSHEDGLQDNTSDSKKSPSNEQDDSTEADAPTENNQENNKPEVISDEEFDHFVLNMPEENLMPIPEVPRAVGEPMPDDGLDSFYLHYLDGFSQ